MFDWIKDLFGGVNKTIETLDVSGNEKAKIKNEFATIQYDLSTKYLELENKVLETRRDMAVAETKSDKWIVYSWRPIVSLTLIALIVLDSFGVVQVSSELYTLATAFLGLTTAGRGLEKAARANKLG